MIFFFYMVFLYLFGTSKVKPELWSIYLEISVLLYIHCTSRAITALLPFHLLLHSTSCFFGWKDTVMISTNAIIPLDFLDSIAGWWYYATGFLYGISIIIMTLKDTSSKTVPSCFRIASLPAPYLLRFSAPSSESPKSSSVFLFIPNRPDYGRGHDNHRDADKAKANN